MLNGQTGLAGKTFQGAYKIRGYGLAGDKMIGDDDPKGTTGRKQRNHNKGIFA